MGQPTLALITPIEYPSDGRPTHPIAGPPAFPTHPIQLPPLPPGLHPSHPIALPPTGERPSNPIYIPDVDIDNSLPQAPGTVWPPLNPGDGVAGKGLLLIWVVGTDKYRWVVVDMAAPWPPIAPPAQPK